ncbi:hypothetical protein [Mycolicibacter longobardus]|uniref:hypothetical protein n=1 Tax=Mycolicibacter longobardus TaxID=1108812 RepID=UPI001055E3BA|nr:hypothetical protein [Mycolicibacter longobardus]MCV7383973.1 hypothetical protein [Mycolicibacter longobardus]
MTEFILGSDHTRALDHFAGFGLSAILEQAGERDLKVSWPESAQPRLTISELSSTPQQVSVAVYTHAVAHRMHGSWVQQTTTVTSKGKRSKVGLFSPRIAVPESGGDWRNLYSMRWAALDLRENQSWIDSLMIQALGEPAYWLLHTVPEPDRGASRWEMKTRNRGEDFTRNRLALLAKSVSARTPDAILAGLAGDAQVDEVGKNRIGSRSGTGLVTPQPVDNAIAWCALWGLSAFRITHRIGRQSFTPGADLQNQIHPAQMALPLVTTPTSPAKLRRVLRSRAFNDAAFGARETPECAVGREALRHSGVTGLVRFQVRKAGSSSAPERQVLAGVFETL